MFLSALWRKAGLAPGSGRAGPRSRCTTPRSSPRPDSAAAIAHPPVGSPTGWAILPEWWMQRHVDRSGSATARDSSATGCRPQPSSSSSGEIDVLTGDWLAELTMLILARQRMKHGPGSGYARTFLTQMEQVLGTCLERGIRVVSNAGGWTRRAVPMPSASSPARSGCPLGSAWSPATTSCRSSAPDRRSSPHLDTGEVLGRRAPITANAYLGGEPVTRRAGRRCRRRDHGSDHRCRAGDRSGRVVARLVVRRCRGWRPGRPGPAGRGGGRRPRHRVRGPGHGRQLLVLHRGPVLAGWLPDRRGGRRRVQRHHEADRVRRAGVASAPSPPSSSTRSPGRSTPTPT